MADSDDSPPNAPCDRCETSIPTDSDRCPYCGYRPAGRYPRALLVVEVLLAVTLVVSLVVFVAGVTRTAPGVPTAVVEQLAVGTPYTAGVSGFFLYYLRRKRRATPTDDRRLG